MARLREFLRGLWEETWESNRRLMISLLGSGADTLLDCGCDDGEFTERVARSVMAGRVIGIEIDKGQAGKAAARGIEVIIGDLNHEFELEGGIADRVMAN